MLVLDDVELEAAVEYFHFAQSVFGAEKIEKSIDLVIRKWLDLELFGLEPGLRRQPLITPDTHDKKAIRFGLALLC